MTPKPTNETSRAIPFPQWVDEELRRQLQIGFDQIDAGQVADWGVNEVLAEAHRRHSKTAEQDAAD